MDCNGPGDPGSGRLAGAGSGPDMGQMLVPLVRVFRDARLRRDSREHPECVSGTVSMFLGIFLPALDGYRPPRRVGARSGPDSCYLGPIWPQPV